VSYHDRWYTWGDIASFDDALSELLASRDVPVGARIAVLLRNRPAEYASLASIISSGRTLVTVNPLVGREKLSADARRIDADVLLCGSDVVDDELVRAGVLASGSLVVELPAELREPPRVLRESSAIYGRPTSPGVAVEMLTSGTTGAPKRIPLYYGDLERSIMSVHLHHGADRGGSPSAHRSSVTVLANPPVHMAGLYAALRTIVEGRAVVLLDRFTLDAWVDAVSQHRPSVVNLPPAALRMLIEANIDPSVLRSVKVITTGAAPVPPELVEQCQLLYGLPVLVSYGATEFAGAVAGWSLRDHRLLGAAKRGSVGRAHPGTRLRVVDDDGIELPTGTMGILEVRSSQIGNGHSWLRTTDLAVLDADGFLWIKGRTDGAINRGGFKVLPYEVETALESHPAVREAAVIGWPDERLGQVPVAAVELRTDVRPPTMSELLDHAERLLTRYQLPTRILIVQSLPRTSGWKVSQQELRALFQYSIQA
jgi:acyl-coenzyme A synthetase/AMP-(fatty) acid ligase